MNPKKKPKFTRQGSNRHSKLGKKRKSKQVWRKPKGRDSKMRLNMAGHKKSPSPGYKAPKSEAGKIQGKTPILVYNISDLNKLPKDAALIIAKVGAKKKLEIIKSAEEKKLTIINLAKGGKK